MQSEKHIPSNCFTTGVKSTNDIVNSSLFSVQDFQDFTNSRSIFNSMLSSSKELKFEDFEKSKFSIKMKRHYKFIVKTLPVFIIVIPSVLKMFFPDVIKLGEFQIGDQKTHPSVIFIDIFSIFLICWMLRFLLDWPWKWYLQIRAVKRKFLTIFETSNTDDPTILYGDATANLRILKFQKFIALVLCFTTPFICGWILLFSRNYILTCEQRLGESGEKNLIFSDLNIGIFISFGLTRLIIQLSEHIQISTAALDAEAEKIVQGFSVCDKEDFNDTSLFDHVQELNERVINLEKKVDNITNRFEVFYKKKKFPTENYNCFLFAKHFKILEKEINEVNHKINTKTTELEKKILMIENENNISSRLIVPHLSKNKSSLHGIPLLSKEPSYLLPNKTSPSYPVEIYSRPSTNPLTRLKINSLWEFFPGLSITNNENSQCELDELVDIQHNESFNNDTILDFNSKPIFGYVIYLPFMAQRMFWRMVSHIPLKLLKFIYFVMLLTFDALIDMYHNKIKNSNKEGIILNIEGNTRAKKSLSSSKNNYC